MSGGRAARSTLVWTLALCAAGAAAADTAVRRAGIDYLSPTLRAMQRDDTQNPAMLWVREGQALWSRQGADGRSCASCHAGVSLNGVAARHPAFDAALDRPVNLPERIDRCRERHLQQAPQGADGAEVLALSAWLAYQARGLPVAPPPDARMASWRQRGEQLWQRRFGQLNLACAQCHDARPDLRLGGAPITQAHPTGYPIYRLEWQTLGSLQRRMRGCMAGVRAEPFATDATEWLALEAWLMQRAAGLPMEGAAVRP